MKKAKESDPFYHSGAWLRMRDLALQRDMGMCQDCMDKMRLGLIKKPRRAVLVHHIQPRKERPDLELDLNNLRSLCFACHEKRHPERRRRVKEEAETPMRVIKV